MNKVANYFSYLPKRALTIALALLSVFALSTAVFAGFGPDRPTKVWQGNGTAGFDHVTFNSFTNVPSGIGDEREFFRGTVVGSGQSTTDPLSGVEDGDEIYLTVYFHNNADPSLGLAGEARNVRVKVELPSGASKAQELKSTIMASNSQPQSIYDTMTISSNDNFELEYVPGSATIITNALNYVSVSDSIVTSGADIGYDALNGRIPGCFEYSGWVNLRVKVNKKEEPKPKYDMSKEVRVAGDSNWSDNANANPGNKLEYRIRVNNTGDADISNVVVNDDLPAGVNYIAGSTTLNGNAQSDNWINSGLTIAKINAGDTATIRYDAKVDKNVFECDMHSFTNTASVKPDGMSKKTDSAKVKADFGDCDTAAYQCDAVNVVKLGGYKVKVDVDATASPSNLVAIAGYTYSFGDGNTLDTTDAKVTHTYAGDGKYNVKVTVYFDLNGDYKGDFAKDVCNSSVEFDTPGKATPPELPNTGPGSIIAVLFGTSTLGAAMRNWAISRKELFGSLLEV